MNSQQYAAQVRETLPEPGDFPLRHLRHTVAAFADSGDDEWVQVATGGIYPHGHTGLTWGDLRLILDWLERSEEHIAPRHPVFGRE